MRKLAIVCFAVAGCGAEEADPGLECSKADRSGTYLAEYTELAGGTCGAIPSSVFTLESGDAPVGAGCVLDYNRWSENDCKLERALTCDFPADNLRTVGVASTEQLDEDGEVLEGVMQMTGYALDTNAFICTSSYETTAVRQ